MEKLAQLFANYIVNDSDLDYEVVKYGVDAILSTVLCFSIALFSCFILGDIVFGIFYIIFLTPIKMQFLSFHCKAMYQCIMTYSMFIISGLLLFNFINYNNYHLPLLTYYIGIVVLCFMVKRELNKHNLNIVVIYLIINTFIYFFTYKLFLISIISLFVEIILVLLLQIKNTKSCQKI